MRSIVLGVALALGPMLGPGPGEPPGQRIDPPERPNIVVLMLDDLGYGPAERLLRTMPTLGPLFVETGLRFTNAYGNDPLCCPGRANVLTGLYSHHHGVLANDARSFRPEETVATALQDAGYSTTIVGKYLNGTQRLADVTPPGWDAAAISQGGYYDYDLFVNGEAAHYGRSPADYSTDVFADIAAAWLAETPPGRPLFAYLAPAATHGGQDPPSGERGRPLAAPRHEGDPRCAAIRPWRPAAYDEVDVTDKPSFVQDLRRGRPPEGWPLVDACEALLAADEMMARVVDILVAQRRFDDTLFVLIADNGMSWGLHRWTYKKVPWSTHLPFYVRWPSVTGSTPRVIEEWVSNVDLAPTLAEVGGAGTLGPYPTGQARPDGVSILPLILDEERTLGREALLEERPLGDAPVLPGWCAIRTTPSHPLGLWHYTVWRDGQRELYDMTADPDELENLAGLPAYAAVERDLGRQLDDLSGRAAECAVTRPTMGVGG